MNNPFENAIKQLNEVAKIIKLDDKMLQRLSKPDNVYSFDLKVTMDNGEERIFKAFRSQHNNALGPYKGGIRYHQGVNEDEVKALSTWMTWKSGVIGLPYGGGKGGIVVDPKELSDEELERLSRAWVRAFSPYIGPWKDVPAPDVNTNPQIMAWMIDEYEKIEQEKSKAMITSGNVGVNPRATFTGKPVNVGGSLGRTEATGLGGFYMLQSLAKKLNLVPEKTSIAVQGFGNVGFWFAKFARDAGFKVVALSDSKGGIFNPEGLDPEKVMEWKEKNGKIPGFEGAKDITNEDLLLLEVDIVVPSALENVVTAENADKIKAKTIIEMANGPVTPEADVILNTKGILSVPDVLANAGGVTVSYFEWVQNLQGYYWEKEEVFEKLEKKMKSAFETAWQKKQELNTDMRMAVYALAVSRVAEAMKTMGR